MLPAHQASYAIGTVATSQGVKLTTHLHLQPRARMSRAVPPLPLYTFKAVQEQLYLLLFYG
jgi:hypothetical protein